MQHTEKQKVGRPERAQPGRALLIAAAVLLALVLVLSLTPRPLGLRPAALIGFPIAILAATALILLMLVLHESGQVVPDPGNPDGCLRYAFVPAVLVEPSSGKIVEANAQAADLLGPANVTPGSRLANVLSDSGGNAPRDVISKALEGGEGVGEWAVRTRTGCRRRMRVQARCVGHGGEEAVVVAFVQEGPEEAIAEFARVQERLMSNISHEVRTPLNVIMGFSELLLTGTLGELTENQLDAARECHIGGQRILKLVTDILDIGRARSYYTPSPEEELSPREIIDRMHGLLSGQARRNDVKIERQVAEDLPTIVAPEKTLKQLLYHLILHAIRRSKPGETVIVSAELDETEEVLEVTIADHGEPVAPDLLVPQEIAVSEQEAQDALAPPLLGLPLCATLAANMGGKLTTITGGEMTRVVFALPLPTEQDV